jgi:hypothetical protein
MNVLVVKYLLLLLFVIKGVVSKDLNCLGFHKSFLLSSFDRFLWYNGKRNE